MSTVPNTFASTSIFKGNITTQDFLHLVRESDGSILGWLDENGIPQGSMAIGGGGGGSSIFVNGTPVNNPDFLAGPGVAYAILGSNVTLSNTGVLSLNSQTGALSAVFSLNSLVGDLNITGAGSVTVTPSGASLQVAVPSLVAGANVTLTPGPGTITVASSGINAAQGPSPWTDVTVYGARPLDLTSETTTATTTAGSPNVSLAAARDFINGDGVVIYTAGAATSQSTPSAPTITSPAITGSTEYQYQCVGVDALGGLTKASPVGNTMVGPLTFGNLPVIISSISRLSDTVTVNFSSPINATAGQQISITGVTGDTTYNGYFAVASAPTTSSVTYSNSGSNNSGGVGASSFGRLCNTFNISSISRSGTTVTVHTNATHNFNVQAGTSPTIVIINGVTPTDFNGEFVLASTPTGTSFTYVSGVNNSESAAIVGGETATVYEYNTVVCPAISGTTVAYYVYGDYGTGSLNLIGKTLPGQKTFTDWGPWINGTFTAPPYVPITPPASAQNQLFASSILFGAGTTSIVLTSRVPTHVISQTIVHDNTVPVALASATAISTGGGTLYFPPPSSGSHGHYDFNYPYTLSANLTIILGSQLLLNETLRFGGSNTINTLLGTAPTGTPQFGTRSYVEIHGKATPLIATTGEANDISGLNVNSGGTDGTYGLLVNSEYCWIHDCFFAADNSTSCAIPLVFMGGFSGNHISNVQTLVYGVIPTDSDGVPGKISVSPPTIPSIWFRGSDAPSGAAPAGLIMDGSNAVNGRGILFDYTFTDGDTHGYRIQLGDCQTPLTPIVSVYGNGGTDFQIYGAEADSTARSIFANWSEACTGVELSVVTTSGNANIVTGLPIPGLILDTPANISYMGQTQNIVANPSGVMFTSSARPNPGPVMGVTYQGYPILFAGPTPYAAFWQSLGSVTNVSAIQSGGGTFTASTWTFVVVAVGWNGGQCAMSAPSTPLTTDGSHSVVVSWAGVSGVQGYDVYGADGGAYVKLNSSFIVASTATFSVQASNGVISTLDGTGLPLIDGTQVATPLLRLANGLYKTDIAAPTMTGNRSVSLPDGASATVIPASLTTTLNGSPYTVTMQGVTSSSHFSLTPTNSAAATDFATGGVYVSTKGANQVVIVTGATAGETFDILATVN